MATTFKKNTHLIWAKTILLSRLRQENTVQNFYLKGLSGLLIHKGYPMDQNQCFHYGNICVCINSRLCPQFSSISNPVSLILCVYIIYLFIVSSYIFYTKCVCFYQHIFPLNKNNIENRFYLLSVWFNITERPEGS